MATTTALMTVEQFWQLPEDEAFQYELHHGELVKVSRPKLRHIRIQYRLQKLLERIFGPRQIVVLELHSALVRNSNYVPLMWQF